MGTPVLLIGFLLPGSNAHAPNEWFSMENFARGTEAIARLLAKLSSLPRRA
jgi:acetylornithine deacetylase/succinyl-diaminopimelate desuccinylase-like protein